MLGQPGERLGAAQLVAVRLEPVVRAGAGGAIVDLHFRDGQRRIVIPFVIVDVPMLEARECDPLVWPRCATTLAGLEADAIGDVVETWLRDLAAGDSLCREHWHHFGDAQDEARFCSAREAGFLGAAPLEVVARKAAPYIFARRHARGRDVVIAARDAELGAVLLERSARHVEIVAPDAAASAWYVPNLEGGEREVAIVDGGGRERAEVAKARTVIDLDGERGRPIAPAPVVPVDCLFDFTGETHRLERPFSVRVEAERALRKPVLRERPAVGGSAGRIVFGLRARAFRQGGADVDLARMLAEAMRDEGFTVDLVDDVQAAIGLRPDLLHAFGLADGALAAGYARAAKNLDIPFALHALYDAPALGGYWGAAVTPYCFRFMQDERTVESLTALMRDRRLAIDQVVAGKPFHPTQPAWREEVRTAVTLADAVFVTGPIEAEAIRALSPEARLVHVPPPVSSVAVAEPVEALVGAEAYALLHAPVESTQNQLLAVRAAELADVPLVLAGPIADGDYAALVRAFAGDRVVMLGEPDAATLEGLYRGADVFMDVAWVGCGLARAARAVSRGAGLVLSDRMPGGDLGLGDFYRGVDPGDVQGIARGLGDTLTIRQHEAARFEELQPQVVAGWGVRDVTTAVAAGYAGAIEKRNQPVLR